MTSLTRIVKAFLRRPFTYRELVDAAGPLLATPPLPQELHDFMATLVGQSGESLLGYWRRDFQGVLEQIASEPSWGRQRAKLLRILVAQTSYQSLHTAIKDVRHVEAWAGYIAGHPVFAKLQKSDPQWSFLFEQLWLISLLHDACLVEIGETLYGIDDRKLTELNALREYRKMLQSQRIKLMDKFISMSDDGDADTAETVAELYDQFMGPVVSGETELLHRMTEEIVNSKLDGHRAAQDLERLENERVALADALTQQIAARELP
jgi:hypothetical protein